MPIFLLLALLAPPPRHVIVFVVDGLRPDLISRENTPNIARLRDEGTNYLNSHSVFPTVTRVNAAALSTGTYPDRSGLTSNTLYDPALNGGKPFATSNGEKMLAMAAARGRMVPPETLSEMLTARGLKFVA